MTEVACEYEFSPEVLFQPMGDEAVLLNLSDNHYYGLNEVGARMWELLSEQGQLEPVLAQLLTEFEVDEETLRQDIATLIDELVNRQMLTRAGHG